MFLLLQQLQCSELSARTNQILIARTDLEVLISVQIVG